MSLMIINLAFAGAVLGFLRYNWPPALVFMGDAGPLFRLYSGLHVYNYDSGRNRSHESCLAAPC